MQLAPMANGKDLELALRIKADLKQGQAELQQLEAALEHAGQQALQTNAQLGTTTSAVDQLSTESSAAAAAVEAVGTALDQAGQQAQQAGTQLNTATGAADQLGAESTTAAAAVKSVGAASAAAATRLGSGTAATRDQQQALAALLGQIDPVVGALQRLDAMQDQLASYRAAGVLDAAGFDQYNAKLAEQRERLVGSSEAMKLAGLSAGEYRQAMRMLPMQLTDVATSLASGMPLWMVAIQQGGQIRDSFGGIGNAARAVMGALSPLAVAISAVVAGGTALLLAFQQGQQEANAYHQALVLTGNAAGTSADQLAGMAQRIDAVSGTQRQAAAALAEIAGTGKFAATQIEAIGTAAVAMENATGRAVSDTVAEFARLAEEPAAASAKLNQQYNYLTAAVYQQIRALEQQGDSQGAAQLAIETYADAMRERAAQVTENLGYLERVWRAVGGAAAEAWDAMLDIGRADTLEEKLAGAYQELERLQKFTRNAAGGIGERRLQEAQAEVERLQQQIQERDAKALEQSQQATVNEAGIEAVQQLDKAVASTASNAEKLKTRLEEIEEQAAAAARAGMPYSEEKLQQLRDAAAKQYTAPTSAGERYAENLRRQIELHGEASEAAKVRYAIERGELGALTDAQKQALIVDAEALDAKNAATKAARDAEAAAKQQAKQTEQRARQQESYVSGLERQAATVGMTAEQVRQYELAEKGLTGALRERAEAALAVIEASEKQRQADANAATNAGLEADYLRAIGRESDAAMLEVGTRFARMQKEFQETGNEAGLAWIDQLIPVEQAKVKLDEVKRQVDAVLAEQQRQEQSVNVQQDAGLLTEMGAREKILGIHRQTYEQLQQIRPVLEEMARQPGAVGESASAALAAMDAQAQRLLATTSLLQETLRDGLTSGLTEALTGLAEGTLTLRDAVTTVADSVIDAMTRMAAESLAQSATKGLMGMFTGVTEAAPQAIAAVQQTASAQQAAITTVQTTQLAADTAMATSAATAATTTATAQAGAAAATEAAWTPAAITASIGSFGAAAAIGLAAVMAALAFKAFSTGGHVTGPGTGTSDDIPAWLSNDEFVTRSAVVRQPGALPFLEDFNRRGMSALDDWASAVRHNTGGLAGAPAPAMPAPGLGNVQLAEPAKALGGATVQNAVNLYAVQDEAQVASMAWSKSGQEHFLVYLQRNSQTVRSILKV